MKAETVIKRIAIAIALSLVVAWTLVFLSAALSTRPIASPINNTPVAAIPQPPEPADAAAPKPPATRATPAVPGTYTLGSGGALCGKKELETALAYKAVHDGDKAGALGLVARGDVDYLEPGTTVDALSEYGELVAVTVMSGTSLGKTCWMPTKMLGR